MDEQTIPPPHERPLTFGQRILNGRNFAAALPNLLFALLYALNIYEKVTVLGLTSRMLKLMMELEFLVIHSFPFLAFFAIGNRSKQHTFFRWGFWGLLCLYLIMAGSMGGFWGIVVFAALTFSTYLGFFFRIFTEQAMVQLAARWMANFVVFLLGAGLFNLPEGVEKWIYEEETLYFGAAYFLVLGCLEWSGVYQAAWIGRLASAIKTGKTGAERKD
ncbi:MAG: hypothetical protein AABZ15_02440 [Nitrospirota bacterium]